MVVLVMEINQVLLNIFEKFSTNELVRKQQVRNDYTVALEPGMM